MAEEKHDAEATQPLKSEPDEHCIRLRAYEIWEAEGMPEGRELDHWRHALAEL